MIDGNLLAMLRCPVTGQSLCEAEAELVERCNAAIAGGALLDAGQREVDSPVDGLLVTADGQWLYPIRGEIPTLIPDWAIAADAL
ncbi:hypothetical protein [Roseimaritima ulvae]|uniref:Trm112p-like protein n=1 Tax=Roseimaritima ulvae TaxID=980254 RepID=A0A5B9R0S7_9BACT|nr:hypothetical protein [Roseimaritima ulvae]QEG39821.1 hypothetical protein UC8_18200 [Roseimaritima ulvae]